MDKLELLGWIANFVVVLQFLQKDMLKLRIWGIIGATLWGIYAVGIDSLPLLALNVLIWLIQGYHIRKLTINKKEDEN